MARENRVDWRPLGYGSGLVLVLAILVLVNKRQLGDVVLLVLIGLVVMAVFAFYLVAPALRRKREKDQVAEAEFEAEKRSEAERTAPWEVFAKTDTDGVAWVAGVQRRVPGDAKPFGPRVLHRFPEGLPDMGRQLEVEGECFAHAYRLNSAMRGGV